FEVFFFFQAEDGIRDFHVTGVQTCALPILDRGLRDDNNWGPQYIASAEMGSYSITTNSAGFRNQYFYPGGDHTSEERPGELGYKIGRASCRERVEISVVDVVVEEEERRRIR